jgi:DNA-binding SARP family transcriptional activator
MEFRILGPLEVWEHGRVVALGGPKQRALLATLLLHANHVVSADRLIDELWGDQPPATADNLLQGYVSQLRRRLPIRQDGRTPRQLLATRSPGYVLRVERSLLDLHRFEQLVEVARLAMAEGAPQRAADALRKALALWRGPALGDVAVEGICRSEVAQLEERRITALEERIEADLRLGRHVDLTGELQALVAENPLRERLRAQLMFALYRSGRQAEALAVYRDARRVLTEELGLEPGPALQRLEHGILAADPALQLPSPAIVADGAEAAADGPPCHLPPDVADFTGREDVVGGLRRLLGQEPGQRGTAVLVAAISGKAGVGKSAVAIRVAQQLRPWYPDGQLYVNLRGTEAHAPAPADILASFLRALGVDEAAVPDGLEERVRRYRARLADRRVLVVLDNAAGEAQVRPLLPPSAGCAALVTSRSRLAGLEAAHHAALEVLQSGEAVELLAKVAGAGRVAAEPTAARTIARLCGDLPLAVRIAGAKLAARPHWRLARLAERLGDERRRLDELRAGDLEVRASFAASHQGQDTAMQRAFRLLGLLETPSFAAPTAAAMLDVTVSDAEELLERLVEAHLLEVGGQDPGGRTSYRFHDLLRIFARERLRVETPVADRQAALRRLAPEPSGADLQPVAAAQAPALERAGLGLEHAAGA